MKLPGLLFLVALPAFSQDTFQSEWSVDRARNPDGVEFTLSLPKTTYYMGESIVGTFQFTSSKPEKFEWSEGPRYRIGIGTWGVEFLADPAARVEDPISPRQAGGVASGPASRDILSEKPYQTERIVNEWLRFSEPGTYRLYARAHIRDIENRSTQPSLASNVVTITIAPAPEGWVADQIAAAAKVLAVPVPLYAEAPKERIAALRTLAFLDTPEAEQELLRHIDEGRELSSRLIYHWMVLAKDRSRILAAMEARLVAPDQPVWSQFLSTLAELNELQAKPVKPAPDYAARLAASLGNKEPHARAISNATLVTAASNMKPAPVWMPLVAPALAEDFLRLPPPTQQELLGYYWGALKGTAILPVLRELYANPPTQFGDPSIEDAALRRMFELAPDEARKLLLAEISKPSSRRLKWTTFAMLPDPTLPDLEETFVTQYEARTLDERLILRYATAKILGRVKAAYVLRAAEQDRSNYQYPRCGSPLVAYFLKYDPAYGEQEARRSVRLCYSFGFRNYDLDAYMMSPALQKLAIEFLMDPSVPVKIEATEMLGKFGSAEAREPVWSAMEYFHMWWNGKETELLKNMEGVRLERALRDTLGKPGGRFTTRQDLSRLLKLCSSGDCKGEVERWMNE